MRGFVPSETARSYGPPTFEVKKVLCTPVVLPVRPLEGATKPGGDPDSPAPGSRGDEHLEGEIPRAAPDERYESRPWTEGVTTIDAGPGSGSVGSGQSAEQLANLVRALEGARGT